MLSEEHRSKLLGKENQLEKQNLELEKQKLEQQRIRQLALREIQLEKTKRATGDRTSKSKCRKLNQTECLLRLNRMQRINWHQLVHLQFQGYHQMIL